MRSFFSLTEISSLPAVSYPAVCRDRRRARQFTAREVRLRQPMVHVKRGAILAHPGPDRAAYAHTAGAFPPFSRAARPQKLVFETFHVPSWYTAVPFWPFNTGLPLTKMV